ncbi:carbohydrate ABC transporter permease [Paenibacillaceae bacterium WGS1546]|uniref:carbohydrate ABC transporter permease n=1 Tax=Cohnella sp. WGS1546 TaxID=3366810 RepID=UPI00372D85C3
MEVTRKKMSYYIGKSMQHFILLVIGLFMLLPFSWMLATSLRLPKDSFRLPPSFFPTTFDFSNYLEVFQQVPFFTFILNSLKIAVPSTILQCLISACAAYAFARMNFKGKNLLFLMILSGLMIPVQVTVIPLFIMFKNFDIIDTHLSLLLPSLVFPMGIFILRQFMTGIPKSYDEAARIDGAGYWRIFWSIILPMSKPALIVAGMLSFIATWNDFFRPLIFINTFEKMTIPLGLTALSGFMRNASISIILAGVIVSLIVPLVLFAVGQRYLIKGISLTGIKG